MKNKYIILIILLASFLRLFQLNSFPSGLNSDEAAIGYNAWSLIQTGKDEHGATWPLVFRSFDDYKPPMYFYLVIPFVKILGLNIWSVRLPSAILGIASVYLIYLLSKKIFIKKDNSLVPILSALILSISPWHLQFSRGGWEVNVATFFILLSIYSLLLSFKNQKYLLVYGLSAVASLYTYHSARIITPLTSLSFLIIYFKDVKTFFSISRIKQTMVYIFICLLLSLPIITQMLSKSGQSRFSGVSIFADQGPIWQATNSRLEHKNEALLPKIIHNRYIAYSFRFVENYLSHYSPEFLFIEGDTIARSKTPETGQTYLIMAPFFYLGLFTLLTLKKKSNKLILSWLLISPFAASLTYQSPHALRSQNMVIPLSIIIAIGIQVAINYLKSLQKNIKYLLIVLFVFVQGYYFFRYLHMYYVHYPKELPYAWQYGFSDIASYLKEHQGEYEKIVISTRYDQPYILTAFFLKYDPISFQKELKMSDTDQYGFSTGLSFGKFEFRSVNYEVDKNLPNTLIVSADEPVDDSKVIYEIKSSIGEDIFKFISTK